MKYKVFTDKEYQAAIDVLVANLSKNSVLINPINNVKTKGKLDKTV